MSATSVAVMGSTGSIGKQTLEVIADQPDEFNVVALGALKSVDLLLEQATIFQPSVVAIADESLARDLRNRLPYGIDVLAGPDALAEASREASVVINGVVGFAGLSVTLMALQSGKRLGLANKESLIAAGPVVRRFRDTPGAELLPVDSEHCAIHQCLRANDSKERISQIVLTASGGPFLGLNKDELNKVTVERALEHPTWTMGPKITVDSSTLMNKGLEVIEAHELFDIEYDSIDVLVHPQSVIHSMVTFSDGSTIAQLSNPDMRLCIGYALAYPDRLGVSYGSIDWSELSGFDFRIPDWENFRCLSLAYEAGREGETAPAWLNAANEVAVAAFLDGELLWKEIVEVITAALDSWNGNPADSVESILDADRESRSVAQNFIKKRT